MLISLNQIVSRITRYSLVLCIMLFSQFSLANTQVVLETSHGEITLELFDEKAPVTVKNFLDYVDSGFYNGTIFHRVIPGFMIQGGGFNEKMIKKQTKAPIVNESNNGERNSRGTIAMARLNAPDSATAQFFINHVNNPYLDARGSQPGYAVFGKVIKGLDIVDTIAAKPTTRFQQFSDVPKTPIKIISASRVTKTQ